MTESIGTYPSHITVLGYQSLAPLGFDKHFLGAILKLQNYPNCRQKVEEIRTKGGGVVKIHCLLYQTLIHNITFAFALSSFITYLKIHSTREPKCKVHILLNEN